MTGSNWLTGRKLLIGLILVIILVVIAGALSGNKKSQNNQATPKASNKTQKVAKIGDTVRDGKLEFSVKNFECAKSRVISPENTANQRMAQGQYCVLGLTVKNIGAQQQAFLASNQKLLDAQGKTYQADSTATALNITAAEYGAWAKLNPGSSLSAVIIFDVPKTTMPTMAVLRDSALSSGAKVNLQ